MNHHVNNVKYLRWMLEVKYKLCHSIFAVIFVSLSYLISCFRTPKQTIPDEVLESHQLSSIILEYRKECRSSDIIQSLCQPEEDGILKGGLRQNNDISLLNGFSLASEILEGGGLLGSFEKVPLRYTHLLQTEGERHNEEIVRGRTTWNRKMSIMPFST
jgi:hypothetical protein